ncbi:endolytic transglycosylase MltG [bacterium]|nr:endolytic transglycosylase MltG [bacterium]
MRALRLFVRTSLFLLILAGLALGTVSYGYQTLEKRGSQRRSLLQPVEITLKPGTSLTALSELLAAQDLIERPLFFEWWVRLFSEYRLYQAGRYRFDDVVSYENIAQKMMTGEIYEPVVLELSIPEGFTAAQIFSRAEKRGIGTALELHRAASDQELWNLFPHLPPYQNSGDRAREEKSPLFGPGALALEGYLFPATYSFTEIPTPKELVATLLSTFFERLPAGYESALEERELDLHRAVTIASLIERETLRDEERPIISQVIQHRLKNRIALAIDASIIYGIPNFDGNLRRRHLKDATNRYNTRVHPGLPPGPICSPGTSSLAAVVAPADSTYLYYVVDAEDFSRHRFSHTLREHNTHVRRYWRARKDQP